jgi:hypothetical protein
VAASWTVGSEEDGPTLIRARARRGHLDLCAVRRVARRAAGGPPRQSLPLTPGRGAVRRRLDLIRLNSATQRRYNPDLCTSWRPSSVADVQCLAAFSGCRDISSCANIGGMLDRRLVGYWSDKDMYMAGMEAADIAFRADGAGWTYWSNAAGDSRSCASCGGKPPALPSPSACASMPEEPGAWIAARSPTSSGANTPTTGRLPWVTRSRQARRCMAIQPRCSSSTRRSSPAVLTAGSRSTES